MNKLSVSVLALALALPALGRAEPAAGATASASVTASTSIKVSDQEALDDDILAVIDLPLVAVEARAAGVEEAELHEALEVTKEVGLSAGEASEVVAEEVESTKKRGGFKKGFGQWVRMQVAAGLRGKKLAAKIRERKGELKELSPAEADKIKGQLDGMREKNRAHREKVYERRKELLAKGKARVLVAKERHEKRKEKLAEAAAKIDAKQDETANRLKALEEKLATASDADKAALEAEKQRLEKAAKHLDKAEDKLEKRTDSVEAKMEKREEKREERLDRIEGKMETREKKREEKREEIEAKRGAKGEGKAPQ